MPALLEKFWNRLVRDGPAQLPTSGIAHLHHDIVCDAVGNKRAALLAVQKPGGVQDFELAGDVGLGGACGSEKLADVLRAFLEFLEQGEPRAVAEGAEYFRQPVQRGEKVMSLERQVRIAAGALVLIGVGLGTWMHPLFYGLSAFVGAGLAFAGITDWCGMGLLLAKTPWNRA